MRHTKINQNGNDGRYMVWLLQTDNDGLGNKVETVIEMKDFAQKVRAENYQRKLETEITYERTVRQEIQATLNAENK